MRLFKQPVAPPVPNDPFGMHQYAVETYDLIQSNWENVGHPFRFWKWRRIHRLAQARVKALDEALDALEGHFDTIEGKVDA